MACRRRLCITPPGNPLICANECAEPARQDRHGQAYPHPCVSLPLNPADILVCPESTVYRAIAHAAASGRDNGACCREKAIAANGRLPAARSEEHTSELQSLMRISYAVFCLKKKHNTKKQHQ